MLQVQPCLPDRRWFPSFTYNRRTKRCQSTHARADIYHPTRCQLPNCSNSFIRPHVLAVHTSVIPSFSTHCTHTKTAGLGSSKNRHPTDIHTFFSASGKCHVARVGFRTFKMLQGLRGSLPRTTPMDPHVVWLKITFYTFSCNTLELNISIRKAVLTGHSVPNHFPPQTKWKCNTPLPNTQFSPFTIPYRSADKRRVYSYTELFCWITGN